MTERRARRALSIVLTVVALAASAPASTAQTPTRPAATVRIDAFSPWNAPDRPLRMEATVFNTGEVPIESARLRLTIYQRALSRSELGRALAGRPQRGVLGAAGEDLPDDLPPGGSVAIPFERDLALLDSTFRQGRRTTAGVYPVEISLRGGDDRELWSGWTAIVFFPAAPETRLNVTWILPFHHPTMHGPDGSFAAATVDAALGPKGTLRAIAASLAKATTLPVTLAPTPALLDELAHISGGYRRRQGARILEASKTDAVPRGAAETLETLRTVAGSRALEIATVPYARADLTALLHAQLPSDAAKQVTVGLQRATEHLRRAPNPAVLVPADLKLDSRAAAAVAGLGTRSIALDADLLPPRDGPFGPDEPVAVAGRGGVRLDALLADAPIRERLEDRESDPVLAGQAALAETAAAWFERPGLATARGIVVATASTPHPDTVRTLTDGFGSAPWLTLRSASQMLVSVPTKQDPEPLPLLPTEMTPQLTAVKVARRAVDILTRIVVEPVGATDSLDRRVLAAESADWAEGTHGVTLARAAKGVADRTVAKVRAEPRRVTLTSRTGQLPVTVTNQATLDDTPLTIEVLVRLTSNKVSFPEGSRKRVLVAGRAETVTFPARARAAGAFGVAIELRTPDGDFPIGGGDLVVRSTAVSTVALIVIGGGIIVMLAAWIRRGGHKRRRRVRTTVTQDAGAPHPA